jgi:preprotein translocase subunit YajC
MDKFILPLLMAAPPADGGAVGAGGFLTSMLPFVAIILIFYFLIIRPQSKKRKETERMLNSLKKGDKIITIGGIHGTIHSIKDNSVIVKVDDNVKLEFLRSAVSNVVAAAKEEKIEDKTEDKKDEKEKPEGQSSKAGE